MTGLEESCRPLKMQHPKGKRTLHSMAFTSLAYRTSGGSPDTQMAVPSASATLAGRKIRRAPDCGPQPLFPVKFPASRTLLGCELFNFSSRSLSALNRVSQTATRARVWTSLR